MINYLKLDRGINQCPNSLQQMHICKKAKYNIKRMRIGRGWFTRWWASGYWCIAGLSPYKLRGMEVHVAGPDGTSMLLKAGVWRGTTSAVFDPWDR